VAALRLLPCHAQATTGLRRAVATLPWLARMVIYAIFELLGFMWMPLLIATGSDVDPHLSWLNVASVSGSQNVISISQYISMALDSSA
jgi:hypothetical protein